MSSHLLPPMATPHHHLLLAALLLISGGHSLASSITPFIRASCSSTLYPRLCEQSLSPYSSVLRYSRRHTAYIALLLAHARTSSAVFFLKSVSSSSSDYRDCVKNLHDGDDRLRRSVYGMRHMGRSTSPQFLLMISNIQTWLSSAITSDASCLDNLSEDHRIDRVLRAAVVGRIRHASQMTSIALTLINNMISTR